MSSKKDLVAQRKEFAKVSDQLWALVKLSGKPAAPIYRQYCPMQKAYWLSDAPAIRNPYYGDAMLECGNVAEKL
jgi:hypothetical protein